MIVSDTYKLRQMNKELVKSTIRKNSSLSKLEVSKITGLSVATCNTLLNELLSNKEILETQKKNVNGGRPATYFKFNQDQSHIACMILQKDGQTQSLTYIIANLLGVVIQEETYSFKVITIADLTACVKRILENDSLIGAIGIGIPGVVENGHVGICDIPAFVNYDLKTALTNQFDVDFVIDNDMNLTVLGVGATDSNDEKKGNVAVVTFLNNELPGSGFLIDGHVLKGHTHFAGEVSFLPLDLEKEQLIETIQSKEGFIHVCSRIVSMIIPIINPTLIVLTGRASNPALLSEVKEACMKYIPEKHIPTMLIKEDITKEYLAGLIHATLKRQQYPYRMTREQ